MNGFGQTNVPPGLSNVVAIAGGAHHSLAVKQDGTVVVWGSIASVPVPIPVGFEVVAIAAGFDAHVSKPVDPRELIAIVEQLLRDKSELYR